MAEGRFAAAGLLLLLVVGGILLLVMNPWYQVDAGEQAVILTWGKISGDAGPGLHTRTPIVNEVHKFNVRTQTRDLEAASASRDLQNVHTTISVIYSLDKVRMSEIYSNLGYNYEGIIDKQVQEVVKSSTAQFNASDLINRRPVVAMMIRDELKSRLDPYGIMVADTPIQNFKFSPEFDAAIEKKNVAMQEKLEAQQKYEKALIDQKAVLATKETEAKALEMQKTALKDTPELIELRKVEATNNWIAKWDGHAMPQVITGDSGMVPFMNMAIGSK